MISNKNLASISDKQNSSHFQDGGIQVNGEKTHLLKEKLEEQVEKALYKVGITLGVKGPKGKLPHQNLTHGNVILVTNFLKTKMINC